MELRFRKSSYSNRNQNCVEVAFHKSSYSNRNQNCVEVAALSTGHSAVRDSQHPHAGHLDFPAAEWSAFVAVLTRDTATR
ncbi:DUF397 domain-containing protein [Marinitenerispora sediminis]|uniref:DUF397 domain-containing protein n=1 Tax=Marinitenerispora sediminis TaxID=1931232 RepID=A0A368T0V0_9ACTN|nr:DUF397 domain-containing protein [Marinitenerispora sediminis]RCV50265.1 DUF397 domain-containing protein [Marinitenerispora sediminis]RCV50474.1 DUF397 domain-containing protein [Marinitenerispora sediminis]RCV52837.1 DUF397 domain-containing protein [Marinitenerispora sediminis]